MIMAVNVLVDMLAVVVVVAIVCNPKNSTFCTNTVNHNEGRRQGTTRTKTIKNVDDEKGDDDKDGGTLGILRLLLLLLTATTSTTTA